MRILLNWWDSKNFGDALNPYILRSLGYEASFADVGAAEMVAVGSYMERFLVGAVTEKLETKKPIIVWGTGFQFEPEKHLWFKNIEYPEEFIRPVEIVALRGELSKRRAENILKSNLDPIALGDPGLLAGKIFDTKGVSKKYRLGIFCHFLDKDIEVFKEIQEDIEGSILIDVESPVCAIIENISKCEAVISSAMHPLIVADSLRVPNKWINVSENRISMYKFDDYYSAFGIKPECLDLNNIRFDEVCLARVHEEYSITDQQVSEIQDQLIRAFPLPKSLGRIIWVDRLLLRLREMLVRDKILKKATRLMGAYSQHYLKAIGRRIGRLGL